MSKAVPDSFSKYFWGDNLKDLSWPKHKKYIIQTLLERGNIASLRWLFKNTNRNEIKKMIPILHLQKKSSNFWGMYLS